MIKDSAGNHLIDPLWFQDLKQHTRYIENLTLCSPCECGTKPLLWKALEDDVDTSKIQIIELPAPKGFLKALALLPMTVSVLWKAIGEMKIIHAGVASWPIPLGWFAFPIALLRKKFSVIVIESSFWRVGAKNSLKLKIKGKIWEAVNRWCVNCSDLAIFTQEQYRESLLTLKRRGRGHIIPASWISEEDILSQEENLNNWDHLIGSAPPVRFLFAGRLTIDKGIHVLSQAVRLLNQSDEHIQEI